MVVDDSKPFTVRLVSAIAQITSIVVYYGGINYNVYPGGEVSFAKGGDTFEIRVGVKNVGNEAAMITTLLRDAARTVDSYSQWFGVNQALVVTFMPIMPNNDWPLIVDVGH